MRVKCVNCINALQTVVDCIMAILLIRYVIGVRPLCKKNKTNHPISSNSYPSATAKLAIFSLKIGGGGVHNQQEHHIILTKYEKYKGEMFWLNIPNLFTLATRRVRPWQREFSSAQAKTSSKAIFQNNPYKIWLFSRSEFLFPQICLIFLQFLSVWFNSVDSHLLYLIWNFPFLDPKKYVRSSNIFACKRTFQLREETTW